MGDQNNNNEELRNFGKKNKYEKKLQQKLANYKPKGN